jgi:hypothetical protein
MHNKEREKAAINLREESFHALISVARTEEEH